MNKYIPAYLIKLHAKRSMRGRFGTVLGANLIETLIILGISGLIISLMPGGFERFELMSQGTFSSVEDQMYYQVGALNLLLRVISMVGILFAFLSVGKRRVFLDVIRHKETKVRKTFSYYSQWYIALLCPLATGAISYGIGALEQKVDSAVASDAVFMLVALMAECTLYFLTFKLFFVDYALSDNGCKNFVEAVKVSWKMTNGKMFVTILALSISFIGWFILSMFTMGLVMIYAIPYMDASFATLYDMARSLMCKNESEAKAEEA